jgi:acetyl-CoA C-acetyltransferase
VGNKIALGQIEVGIAGGVDTNSDLPIMFNRDFAMRLIKSTKSKSTLDKLKLFLTMSPKSLLPVTPGVLEPRTGLTMGQSCEQMAQQWGIPREEQDELSLKSHQNAVRAYSEGFYDDMIVPMGKVEKDAIPRADTSMEKLAKLKTVFATGEKATLTAGNSSPLTDGAAAVLLASESWAKKRGLPVLAYLTYSQVCAVDFVRDEGLLMAPAYAVPRLIQKAGIKLQDFDFYEIHEAFAAQVLCTLKAWESPEFCKNRLGLNAPLGRIDRSKLNVKGGSVGLGHPFAATGARIVGSLAKMLSQKGSGRGLISICTAGGMGVTAILERP